MGHFKSFLLGVAVAFGVYYITRKDEDGISILDEILAHPSDIAVKAKDLAIAELVSAIKTRF